MRFPDTYEKRSGRIHDLLKRALKVLKGGDVLEAAVGEPRAVVSLGWSEPFEGSADPVVVVVLTNRARATSVAEAGDALTVEDLLLEHAPEGFDVAVCPRRADLGAQVLDAESSCDSHLGRHANCPHPAPDLSQIRLRMIVGRPPVLGRKEEEPGPLLIAVTPKESTRIGRCCGVGLRHPGTLRPARSYLSGNLI